MGGNSRAPTEFLRVFPFRGSVFRCRSPAVMIGNRSFPTDTASLSLSLFVDTTLDTKQDAGPKLPPKLLRLLLSVPQFGNDVEQRWLFVYGCEHKFTFAKTRSIFLVPPREPRSASPAAGEAAYARVFRVGFEVAACSGVPTSFRSLLLLAGGG